MIDWEARIADLANKLAREYTMTDRTVVEVLLSSLVNCPATPSVWLILETNWYSRNCYGGWFSLGKTWLPNALARLRARFPWRAVEEEIREWIEEPSDPRLFIECDFDRYPYFHKLTLGSYILNRSLRIRTRTTRSVDPIAELDIRIEERRQDELASVADLVLRPFSELRDSEPPVFRPPAGFLYQLETLQRLSPWYPDWSVLVKAFGALAIRHAHLYGRRETGPEDNLIMARVAQDSVPLWITRAIRLLAKGPAMSGPLEVAMGLEDKTRRSGHGAHYELMRLRRGGVVHWSTAKMSWSLVEEHRAAVLAVVEGHAFGALQAVCA